MTHSATTHRQQRFNRLRHCARRLADQAQQDHWFRAELVSLGIALGQRITALKERTERLKAGLDRIRSEREMLLRTRETTQDPVHLAAIDAGIVHLDESYERGRDLLHENWMAHAAALRDRAHNKELITGGLSPVQRPRVQRPRIRRTHRNARAKVAVRTVRSSRPSRGTAKKTTSSATGDPVSDGDPNAHLRSSAEVSR